MGIVHVPKGSLSEWAFLYALRIFAFGVRFGTSRHDDGGALAVIAGCDLWVEIAMCDRPNLEWFKSFFILTR